MDHRNLERLLDPNQAPLHLRWLLDGMARKAGAARAALFVRDEKRLLLAAQRDIDQQGLDAVQAAWAHKRSRLHAGEIVRHPRAVIAPLLDGARLLALVYLDRAAPDYPDAEDRLDEADVVACLRPRPQASSVRHGASLSPAEATEENERERLALALDHWNGNVAAVAHDLKVARQTVYQRAARLGLAIEPFRSRRRRSCTA